MFIWDFVADKILGQIVDWFYSQVVGFLGNFFSEMGSMGRWFLGYAGRITSLFSLMICLT